MKVCVDCGAYFEPSDIAVDFCDCGCSEFQEEESVV